MLFFNKPNAIIVQAQAQVRLEERDRAKPHELSPGGEDVEKLLKSLHVIMAPYSFFLYCTA